MTVKGTTRNDFDTDSKINTLGIDLVLSIDVSASMLAKDFKPNRLEAAKNVASDFITARPNDRIGLVSFSGESFTQVPITSDHLIVQEQLAKMEYGFLAQGTAIGMGIATGVNRLKNSEAKSKVIILMTDGVNNAGIIDPLIAIEEIKNGTIEPNFILLDVNMPGMSGWGFIEEMKNSGKEFPVVMFTASVDEEDRDKADANPIVKMFMDKPLTRDKLVLLEPLLN